MLHLKKVRGTEGNDYSMLDVMAASTPDESNFLTTTLLTCLLKSDLYTSRVRSLITHYFVVADLGDAGG